MGNKYPKPSYDALNIGKMTYGECLDEGFDYKLCMKRFNNEDDCKDETSKLYYCFEKVLDDYENVYLSRGYFEKISNDEIDSKNSDVSIK